MPDTESYLTLALAVVALTVAAFMLTMYLRYNSLKKDIAVIEQIREEEA